MLSCPEFESPTFTVNKAPLFLIDKTGDMPYIESMIVPGLPGDLRRNFQNGPCCSYD